MSRTILVTTTHDRPFCFWILEMWIAAQTVQPDLWLVINDSEEPAEYEYRCGQQVILRTDHTLTAEEKALPSICKNWLEAIKHIKEDDLVIVAEDDDFYDPTYIQTIRDMLETYDLVGISHDVYFKLPTRRFQRMHNTGHASLACSGFRGYVCEGIEYACKIHKSVFIDMYLWVECGTVFPTWTKKLTPQPIGKRMIHVGMKGMPGAKGLGVGHDLTQGSTDPNFLVLAEWIGSVATSFYKDVWREFFEQTKSGNAFRKVGICK